MAYYLGVDLGLSGAIAVISTVKGTEPKVWDMPVITYQTAAGRERRRYNAPAILHLIAGYAKDIAVAGVEAVHAMPKGSSASFSMGRGAGLFEMLFVALDIKHRELAPTAWKRYFRLTHRSKGQARVIAAQYFPGVPLGGRDTEDRAEALLIAEYVKMLDVTPLDPMERGKGGSPC